MTTEFCQSCGMPMSKEFYSTNEDKSENREYCKYCFEDGKFKDEMTMEQMIEFCVPHMVENNSDMSEEQARGMMMNFFPSLKRWR